LRDELGGLSPDTQMVVGRLHEALHAACTAEGLLKKNSVLRARRL
jgi:hypothetical protein